VRLRSVARKIHFGADDGACWLWLGKCDAGGYGRQSSTGAHRAVYSLFVGPIPVGLTLDHLCGNRRCVNPSHLEPCSMRENTMRGNSAAAVYAARTHCKHGHEFTAENTRPRPPGGRSCRACDARRSQQYKARHV
jgi:hypothetical protein